MTEPDILKEARRLYDLGWAVHFIKPNSKAPVKAGWSGPKRDSIDELYESYQKGMGLGVRLGEASKLNDGGYLANIDIDIKSSDPRHKEEALKYVEAKFPELKGKAPIVLTGYGMRVFTKTAEPERSGKLKASGEETVVFMPTAEINKRQLMAVAEKKISQKQLDKGYRVRPAWEVEFMSMGKQVVLPPSIHPETKKPYLWVRPLDKGEIIRVGGISGLKQHTGRPSGVRIVQSFKPVPVDLISSTLSDHIVDMILEGEGISDRSSDCFSVCLAMVGAGFSDEEIMSVLTDRSFVLGETAYEHTKSDRRSVAAAWIKNYNIKKARETVESEVSFKNDVIIDVAPLSEEESKAQLQELVKPKSWKEKLQRTGKNGDGQVKNNIFNVINILSGTYGKELFKEDLFSGYHVFGLEVPWGEKIGAEFSDRSRVLLAEWFSAKWGIDPNPNVLYDAVVALAARNTFHPIKDYLDALQWDGVPRVDTWLKTYMSVTGSDELYLKEASRKFFIAMIERIYKPGCKYDYMLILKGKQGLRKSMALSVIAGEKYYSQTLLTPGHKDSILKMKNKWILEYGELSAMRADVRELKNFLSTTVDRDRLPFARLAVDYPRQCVFAGSTNEERFLYDDTGNRRYWPVEVGNVNIEGLKRDRDQLFGEAMWLYAMGETNYMSKEAEEKAEIEQTKFMPHQDILVDQVAEVLKENNDREKDSGGLFPQDGFKLFEVMKQMPGRDDMPTQKRVAAALRKLGYINRVSRARGTPLNLWFKQE